MRTKGATSYSNVKIADLASQFSGETVIPVSRKWLTSMGVTIHAAPAKVITAQVVPTASPNEVVAVEVTPPEDNGQILVRVNAAEGSEDAEARAAILAGVAETTFED